MPTPNYKTGLIYKLVYKEDYDNENIYIGSTTNFRGRKRSHKSHCNNIKDKCHNQIKYQIIRETGWDNWDMIQIEPFPCNSKKELLTRERYWIEQMKPNLNTTTPTRTTKEWQLDNRDKCREASRRHYYNHYDKEKERATNCYWKYKDKNQENHNNSSKEWYRKNADEINQKRKDDRVICECCGASSRKTDLKKHQKTAKCILKKEEK